jgi:ubiquinone/menaquinone biosynthesis C-methylase UbiE/uncharacterized protein YbaR (Trm112 family)
MSMISSKVLELLCCPDCKVGELRIGTNHRPELECRGCQTTYPIVDSIPDLVPVGSTRKPGQYRTETLFNLVAGVYDWTAPVMSSTIWGCSPLRYIDSENAALGRANGGVYLKAPIGTGLVLDRSLANYHDVTILAVDLSWKMLQRAQKRLAEQETTIQFLRADPQNLPIRDACVQSVQSVNGLHTFDDRESVLREFHRCLAPEGALSGSALFRAQMPLADFVFDRYERYGVYPMLRSAEFLTREIREQEFQEVQFETHGSVLFYSGCARSS